MIHCSLGSAAESARIGLVMRRGMRRLRKMDGSSPRSQRTPSRGACRMASLGMDGSACERYRVLRCVRPCAVMLLLGVLRGCIAARPRARTKALFARTRARPCASNIMHAHSPARTRAPNSHTRTRLQGAYALFTHYPKFIVDFQEAERQRIVQARA